MTKVRGIQIRSLRWLGISRLLKWRKLYPIGVLDPDEIMTPGVFRGLCSSIKRGELEMGMGVDVRNRMAKRAAQEIKME